MTNTAPIIVWFRQDLRTRDHPALKAAADSGAPVLPLYILDDETPGDWKMGGASRWWLHGSLSALEADLKSRSSRLTLRKGQTSTVLKNICAETGAKAIYFSRGYEPHQTKAEAGIAAQLKSGDVECKRYSGSLLFEPEAVKTKTGGPFKVFTPFYKACLKLNSVKAPVATPKTLRTPKSWPKSDNLDDWNLLPTKPDWTGGLRETWTPGAGGAKERLKTFLDERAQTYGGDRDRPDRAGTSALSPHLHFGEISPRQIWNATMQASAKSGVGDAGRTAFLRELIWREFSYHLLHHWPHIPEVPFNEAFGDFPWRDDLESLTAWQRGQTGYPIVDAGMRQLWHTGWMHNRVRMIVASFLTKHLLIHWREGAAWFWDTLVDADLANNSASWQWVAGSGADAAPYFRIFNPILQGSKFDPKGAYVRTWIPELRDVPDKAIHAPWEHGAIPDGYPDPIVDHKGARQRALAAYQDIKKS